MSKSTPRSPAASSTPRAPTAQTSATTRSAQSWSLARAARRKSALFIVLLGLSLFSGGCYYGHLAQGQAQLLWKRIDIEDALAAPDTPPILADRLRTVIATRSFAGEIGLEVGGQYTSYVPWTGDRIITTLVVTEPGELDARPFVFPIVGSVPYKGFFDRSLAEDQAENFRDQGFDVCLTPITAYSTLGFFDDPVSAPMLRASQGRLVETLLHEFVHATFFVESEPGFNEGAALFIGQEASVLFFVEVPEKAHRRRQEVQDARLLAQFLLEFQRQIQALYAEADDPAERGRRRAVAEQAVRIQLAELPFSAYDGKKLAASLKLNDACLALRGTYTEDLPLFERALAGHQNDLKAFIAAVRTAAESEEARESLFDPSRSDPDR